MTKIYTVTSAETLKQLIELGGVLPDSYGKLIDRQGNPYPRAVSFTLVWSSEVQDPEPNRIYRKANGKWQIRHLELAVLCINTGGHAKFSDR